MTERRFTIPPGGDPFVIPLPFDPKVAWGRTRAPVRVTVGGHTYRSTVTTMGGRPWIPFRRSNREAAGVAAGEPFEVAVALDLNPRTVDVPNDLAEALDAADARAAWDRLSYSHRRERADAITEAKRPETRARRIAACVGGLR